MNNATILAANPYDRPPPVWQRQPLLFAGLAVFILTTVLTVVSYPPFGVSPMAYIFATPAVFWAYRRPPFRLYAAVVLGSQALAWTILLGWLHNVTWIGLILLGPIVGAWVGSWFLAAWWMMPRIPGNSAIVRIIAVLGMAGLWVVMEWSRTWFLGGYPWLTLATSQWERVSILQIAAFTGAGGVSFVLMAMNIGFAAYAHRLGYEGATGLNRRSQEFFAVMFLLLVCLSIHVQETIHRAAYTVPLARVAVVQPNVPQEVKWDPTRAHAILDILEQTTLAAAATRPDLILWPEAVTPLAIRGDESVKAWTESLVHRAGVPLLLGLIAVETTADEELWYNGAFLVEPDTGLRPNYYAKRRLVPFGEFVPFRPVLGWIGKFVPIGGDFQRGELTSPMLVSTKDRHFVVGSLICYEDIFPRLSRDSVRAGADVLVVLTNNGWFGEGGAAHQHASHSVLRAIETRRPVLRAGNAGWSGWIDEFGSIRASLRQVTETGADGQVQETVSIRPGAEGSIYFRGSATMDVTRDARWIGQESFYVRHGDWFVMACAGLFAFGVALVGVGRPVPVAAPAAPETEDGPKEE